MFTHSGDCYYFFTPQILSVDRDKVSTIRDLPKTLVDYSHTFEIEAKMGLSHSTLETMVQSQIAENSQTPFLIPYSKPPTCLLALPDKSGCKGSDAASVAKYCDLVAITNPTVLATAISNGIRSDATEYKYCDLSCARYDRKPKGFDGDWLDSDGLKGALAERNIATSSSASDKDLKAALANWIENRNEAELDCELLIIAVVAKPKKAAKKIKAQHGSEGHSASSSGDASTIATTEGHDDDNREKEHDESDIESRDPEPAPKKGKKDPSIVHVLLLPPEAYRNTAADYHCAFKDQDHASTVVLEFDIRLDSFEALRERVIQEYGKIYPKRNFDDDAMYVQLRSNAKTVVHLDNLATALSKVNARKEIRITMSAMHTDPAGAEGYEKDSNGHILAPVSTTTAGKGLAAKASRELAERVEAVITKLYTNPSSPFYKGIDKSHSIFIKQYLLTTSEAPTALLQQLERNQFPQDINSYLAPLYKTWANPLLLNQTRSVPEKGKFPPLADGDGGIPARDLNAPTATNPAGATIGGVGGSGAPPTVYTAVMALAGAIEKRDTVAAKGGGGVGANENHINEWPSVNDFFTHIRLDPKDAPKIVAAGFDTVEALHEAVNAANKAGSFMTELQTYITGLSPAGCFKILGGSKNAPPSL